jgi:CBS domain containing-hemolysin-like protein
MTTFHVIGWVGVAALGVAGSALCNGMEIGSYSVNRVRLRLRIPGSYAARLLASELEHLDRLLATLLIANSMFHYLAALALTELLGGAGLGEWSMVLIEVAALTPLLFIVAESLPKEVFRAGADTLTYGLVTPLVVARLLLTWTGVLPLVRLFAEVIARRLGVEETGGLTRTGGEHVAAMMKEAEGALSASQMSLVDRALAFHRTTVSEEMVPWGQVVTIGADWDRPRVLALLQRSHHTVFPVVDARGRVAGVLRHTDPYVRPDAEVAALALAPAVLRPGDPLREAILRVRESPGHMGIVESPGGRPMGLVTLEDLVEPLIGRFDEG